MSVAVLTPPDGFTFGYIHPVSHVRTGPFPKQALAHRCPADLTFFGGAAGPGKSEMQVVEAVTMLLQHPGAEAALFRRKHTELEKSLIGRFRKLVPKSVASYNSTLKVARFFNGSQLWFCHCNHESSVYDYQSAEWIYLGVDESTHLTEFQIGYMATRVRSAIPGSPKRIVLTSNPGNVGHGWHKRWFVRPPAVDVQAIVMRFDPEAGVWVPGNFEGPVRPMDVWRPWPAEDDPTPPEDVDSRCFIPARMEDNPALMEANPRYKAKIYALGGDKGRQLAEGDWDANDSMIVGAVWKERHVVTRDDLPLLRQGVAVGQVITWHVLDNPHWRPPPSAKVWGSVDYGYGAPWSFHLHAGTTDRHVRTWHERYMTRKRDRQQAEMIHDDILRFADLGAPKPDWIVCDPAMWNSRQEMGISESIAEVYQKVLAPIGVRIMKGAAGRGARVSRPQRWLDALAVQSDGLPFWSVTTACPDLIRTVPEVPWDEEDPDVEDDDSENHAYEDVGRFFEARPAPPRAKLIDEQMEALDPLSRAHWEGVDERFRPHPGGFGGSFQQP